MSVSPASLAASLISMQNAGTTRSLAPTMVKQQAEAEASFVSLVEQALDAAKAAAPPPPGQVTLVDVTA